MYGDDSGATSAIKWISACTCTAGAFISASLLFEGAYFGDFALALILSLWLILLALSDFRFEAVDNVIDKYLLEACRSPGKRGTCIIVIALMIPCYSDWTKLTAYMTSLFVLTKILWVILLVGGALILIIGLASSTCYYHIMHAGYLFTISRISGKSPPSKKWHQPKIKMVKASGCAGEVAKWFTVIGASAACIGIFFEMILTNGHIGLHVYQLSLFFWMTLTLISDFGTPFGESFISNYWSGFMNHHLFRGFMMIWWGLINDWYTSWGEFGRTVSTTITHTAFLILIVCASCVILIGALAMCGVC